MIWLTWRQHRAALAGGLAVAAAIAAYLVITGLHLRRVYDELGLGDCAPPVMMTCGEQGNELVQLHNTLSNGVLALLVVPALIGALWGAPLVAREVEQGTHRLAWTQSVTRKRWLAVKVIALVLATTAGLAALSLLAGWWYDPFLTLGTFTRFDSNLFSVIGVAPVGYGVAALAIGVAAGTFTRRLVPAIVITLVLFTGLRTGVELWLRPGYMAPVTTSAPLPGPGLPLPLARDGWRLSSDLVTAEGEVLGRNGVLSLRELIPMCGDGGTGPPGPSSPVPVPTPECLNRLGVRQVSVHHPEDRYWRFQLTEVAIYLALSGGVLVASAWWVRHRIA